MIKKQECIRAIGEAYALDTLLFFISAENPALLDSFRCILSTTKAVLSAYSDQAGLSPVYFLRNKRVSRAPRKMNRSEMLNTIL